MSSDINSMIDNGAGFIILQATEFGVMGESAMLIYPTRFDAENAAKRAAKKQQGVRFYVFSAVSFAVANDVALVSL